MAVTRSSVLLDPKLALSPKESDKILVTNTTSHNIAEDTSIQINGHIANEIHSYNGNTVIFNFISASTPRRRTRPVKDSSAPKHGSQKIKSQLTPRSPITDKAPVRKTQLCPEGNASRRHKPTSEPDETQYLILSSNLSGKKGVVCAINRVDCQRNFISDRIVGRFALTAHIDCSADTATIVTGNCRITPSRSYVVLVNPAQHKPTPHRFYVVEHCLKFDILIGSESITSLALANDQEDTIGSLVHSGQDHELGAHPETPRPETGSKLIPAPMRMRLAANCVLQPNIIPREHGVGADLHKWRQGALTI
ncbi:hypothetical protein DE146DRAFT_243208 [Phaeosphaeria sp. MPI-PUGE-AT-0046c]|nr:hypothetical protein DE146DRAFT_243208 [Phaeosphaeria sp. MPI-PUGE-AT-0046c]